MEMATNVREFLVGVEPKVSPDKEKLLESLQGLHEDFLRIMNDFTDQVSELALSMSPEARVVAHRLRLRLYQDWRALLMERVFTAGTTSPSITPPMSPTGEDAVPPQHECQVCVCGQSQRLDMYKHVIEEFIEASPTIKSTPGATATDGSRRVFESTDSGEFSDDGIADQLFAFPEFLRSSPLA